MLVRLLQESDFPLIESWWKKQTNHRIWRALLPDDTTFVVEDAGVPIVTACLYLMNVPDACMVENVAGNPDFKGETRQKATRLLFQFLEVEARRRGYKTLVIFTAEEKLKTYYESFGYIKTLENVTTFAKSI